MSIPLKIKTKVLAEEAKIIRLEKRKQKAAYRRTRDVKFLAGMYDLQGHAVKVVRFSARCTHLARMFLRGRPYRVVERTCHVKVGPDHMEEIIRMIGRYGRSEHRNATLETRKVMLKEWLTV